MFEEEGECFANCSLQGAYGISVLPWGSRSKIGMGFPEKKRAADFSAALCVHRMIFAF
jgi:hypothetical protein